jgi:hypothetical protein
MLIDIPGKMPNGLALREYLEKRVAPSLPPSLLPSLCAVFLEFHLPFPLRRLTDWFVSMDIQLGCDLVD